MIGRALCQRSERHLVRGGHGAADRRGRTVNRCGAVIYRRSGGFAGAPAQLHRRSCCAAGLYVRDGQAAGRICGYTAGLTDNSRAATEHKAQSDPCKCGQEK